MEATFNSNRHSHLWSVIRSALCEQRQRMLLEELAFFVYRSDTNAVLARGILGYEAAKERANQIRKQQGLPWSVVKFRAEPRSQSVSRLPSAKNQERWNGLSNNSRWFTTSTGQRFPIDYSNTYNPSKRSRFRGYTDSRGNYHDID